MSVLNLHKDERHKPEKWIPVGWMPIFDEKQTRCPGKGYESDAARKARLFLTAAGADQYHRGLLPGPVVDWGEEQERTHSPGPNASHYEAFQNMAGADLACSGT